MIVALTGTPGTGKTSIAAELEEFEIIDLTEFVKEHGLGDQEDEFEVDLDAMVKKLDKELNERENYLIEGHLSHHYPSDYCIVLRCDPEELEERLSERGYSEQKIRENLESEMLDVILSEAVQEQEEIIEVDTTNQKAENIAEEIERKIENGDTGYGQIDWTDRI